jgi:hypothetical protein
LGFGFWVCGFGFGFVGLGLWVWVCGLEKPSVAAFGFMFQPNSSWATPPLFQQLNASSYSLSPALPVPHFSTTHHFQFLTSHGNSPLLTILKEFCTQDPLVFALNR